MNFLAQCYKLYLLQNESMYRNSLHLLKDYTVDFWFAVCIYSLLSSRFRFVIFIYCLENYPSAFENNNRIFTTHAFRTHSSLLKNYILKRFSPYYKHCIFLLNKSLSLEDFTFFFLKLVFAFII